MMALNWFPAPFQPHGGTSGDGARRLLGQPSLDPLTVLMRETLQNSWDARSKRSGGSLGFRVHLRRLDKRQQAVLNEQIFAEGLNACGLGLGNVLKKDPLWVLEISDSGTNGLAGPIRADLVAGDQETTNFIDFVFNLGAVRNEGLGGGTYGFGKTIAYLVGKASTALISSNVPTPEGLDHRFIGSAIGPPFPRDGKRYTGRHWWGRVHDGHIEPERNASARSLATSLGLPVDSPGTSVLILDPDLRDRNPSEAMRFMMSSLLWHAWPKLIPPRSGGSPAVKVSAFLNGSSFPGPRPEDEPRLRPFIESLHLIRATQAGREPDPSTPFPTDVRKIRARSIGTDLGHVGMVMEPTPPDPGIPKTRKSRDLFDACPFEGASHHIALMRQAELIVTYLVGQVATASGLSWGGVFKCLEEVDEHFAMAEPPAHDGWDPQFVDAPEGRTCIRVALRDTRKAAREFPVTSGEEEEPGGSLYTARLGDLLAGMIPSVSGTRPTTFKSQNDRGRQRRKRNSGSVSFEISGTELAEGPTGPEVHVDLILENPGSPVMLKADLRVRTDTGPERSAPEGVRPPKLGSMESESGVCVEEGPEGCYEIRLAAETEKWTLRIHNSDPAALDLHIEAIASSEGEG